MRFFCFVVSLCIFLLVAGVSAETTFFADFLPNSDKAVPDLSVNDPQSYIPENPFTHWSGAAYDWDPGFLWDGFALRQNSDLCRTSGYTPFPGVKDFKDGMIQLIVSFGDDDGFGIQFRKSDSGDGYMVYFGGFEKPYVALFELPNLCVKNGDCLVINKRAGLFSCLPHSYIYRYHKLGFGRHFRIDNTQPILVQIEVLGGSMKVWYKKIDSPAQLHTVRGNPIIEFDSLKYLDSGGVGIWHESWALGTVDSIRITDALGLGTDPAESIAVGWEDLKQRNAWKEDRVYEICDIDKNGIVDHWDVRYARLMIHDPRDLFPNWDADVNQDGKEDDADVKIIKDRAIEVALEWIEAAAAVAAAPSLKGSRSKIGTWGALKR